MRGLSDEEVRKRIDEHLVNYKVKSQTKSIGEIVRKNVFTYFNLIFLILAVLLGMVFAWKDMLFLAVIIANTVIGIVQEIHSKNVLDKLSILAEPQVLTIRNGENMVLPPEELVQDDVIILEAGNQIPADAVVLEGEVNVNEALLTGEADEIKKTVGDELLSGSYVVSGSAVATLVKVGEEAYISKLTLMATQSKEEEQSEMIRSLNSLILVMGILIIPIGISLFVQSYVLGDNNLHDSITGMVAAVIGMIPEGLYLLATVAMAASTIRLAEKKILVHDMKCIEGLARVNVLCVDKTGTITEPGMEVVKFLTCKELLEEERELKKEQELDKERQSIEALISDFACNMQNDNETMKAIKDYFNKGTNQKAKKVVAFSPKTKYSAVTLSEGIFLMGAPEFVLGETKEPFTEKLEEYENEGYRILAFVKYDGELETDLDPAKSSLMGMILLSNPIRTGAKEIFQFFAEHEVETKVISGDNPITVSAVAKQAGIQNCDQYVDATTLKSSKDYFDAVEKYTIFGRVTPEQKRELVHALSEHKKTVAMTGDGVNDVLALKDADCSIALASGSDAAANVSQLVLLESDFSQLPSVVMEGRRVVNNIQRTASLYIVKNIFSMLLSIFSVLFMFEYPLEPTQITLISMFTIGIPSVILALEPNQSPIKGNFLLNVMMKALPAGLTDFIVVSGLVIFCHEFEVEMDCLSTSCTVLVAIVGFMILYRIAKPMTKWHLIMLLGVVCGWIFCMRNISHFFSITSISKQCAMLMIIFAIITEPCLRYLSLLTEHIGRFPVLQRLLK